MLYGVEWMTLMNLFFNRKRERDEGYTRAIDAAT